jgi:hypothetical protein
MNETRIESLRFSPVEDTSTGTITALSTHDTSMVFFTGAGAVTIESISYGSKGKVLKLANLTGSTVTIKHNTGSTNKNKIITSDATDLVVANNEIATLLYDHVNSRWKIDGAASGGGGGGSAYPDTFLLQASAGTIVLTGSNQGFVTSFVPGITFQLPSTASDGTTFKFYAGGGATTIDPDGAAIITYASSSPFVLAAGQMVTLVSINTDIGAGLQLYWVVTYASQVGNPVWSSGVNALPGQILTESGEIYICRQTSIGTQPSTSSTVFYKIPASYLKTATQSISDIDISFTAATAPSSFSYANISAKSDGNIGQIIVEFLFDTTGTDVTQIVVDLTTALGTNADLAALVPGVVLPGVCTVGALDWPCRWTGSTVVMTIPSGITLSGIGGSVFKAIFNF